MTFINVKNGDRITIQLSSKSQKVQKSGQVRNRRPIRKKKGAKYEPRRLSPDRAIRFFDCGQILSGESYIDIPFSREGTLTGYPGDRPEYVFTLSDFDALEDYLFLTPLSQWASKYCRLDFEEGYKLAVDVDFKNPGSNLRSAAKENQRYDINNDLTSGVGWSAAGMAQVPHSTFELFGYLGFNSFPDGEGYKVTSTRDYLAANIPGWTFPEKCDVFLLPKIITSAVFYSAGFYVDYSGSSYSDYWVALLPFAPVPRSLYADRIISILPEPNRPWLNYFTFISACDNFSTDDQDYLLDNHLITGARAYQAHTISSVTTWSEIAVGSFPRAALESNLADGLFIMTAGFELDLPVLTSTVELLPGVLLAVVTSGSSEYYIWRT